MTDLQGAIGSTTPLSSLTTDALGTTQVRGNITTVGDITIADPLTLLNDATFTSANGNINLLNVTGTGQSLTLNTATTGTTTLDGSIVLNQLTPSNNGILNLSGSVSTIADLTVNQAIVLLGDTTIDTGTSNLTLNNEVDGGFTLVLTSVGITSLNGAIGSTTALANLTTNLGGTTQLGANLTTADGNLTFNDDVLLATNSTLTTGLGNLIFAGLIDGAFNLLLS